jgi:hypothetical protein
MPKVSIELRRIWEERIQKQKTSGLSIQRWCRENQLAPHLFHYWNARLFPKTLLRDHFIEVPTENGGGITLEVRGICLRLEKDFDAPTLKRCLEVLKVC